jgi:hypothetical protein
MIRIDPESQWRNGRFDSALIVNSVDQQHSEGFGVSAALIHGCETPGSQDTTNSERAAEVTEVILQDCIGPYRRYGFKRIADIVVVNWVSPSGELIPCKDLYKRGSDASNEGGTAFVDCTTGAVRGGLEHLFGKLRKEPQAQRPLVIVMPEIGTGFGNLRKFRFYLLVVDVIEKELMAVDSALPSKLVFQLRDLPNDARADDSEAQRGERLKSAFALAASVSQMDIDWNRDHPRPDTRFLARLCGLFAAITVGILLAGVTPRRGGLANRMSNLRLAPTLLYLLRWLVSASGVAEGGAVVLAAFEGQLPWLASPVLQFACGVVSVGIAGVVLAALENFKHS